MQLQEQVRWLVSLKRPFPESSSFVHLRRLGWNAQLRSCPC